MQFLIGSLFGSKRDLLDVLLSKGMVMVHLDARCDGVEVPGAHADDFHLRLNLSHHFDIDDFVFDEDGVRASLSFRGERHFCVLPWPAVFAMTSHVEPVGYLWPEDLPSELADQLNVGSAHREVRHKRPSTSGKPGLRLVEGGRDDDAPEPPRPPRREHVEMEEIAASSDGGDESDESSGRRYGHLRVVK